LEDNVPPQINDTFVALYNGYAQRVPEEDRERVSKIGDLIDKVADSLDLSETLRPDAKLYLLVNYHNLLVTPLMQSETMSEEVLFDTLEQDLVLALRRAKKQADWADRDTISGHLMLSTIDEVWSQSVLLGGGVSGLTVDVEADPYSFWPKKR
jgi:hypothetical protein